MTLSPSETWQALAEPRAAINEGSTATGKAAWLPSGQAMQLNKVIRSERL